MNSLAEVGDTVYYDLKTKHIFRETPDFFLASSLGNLLRTQYAIDRFRNEVMCFEQLGRYFENKSKYANWLKTELLKIDEQLFEKDVAYYWGSMIESVEQGLG